MSSSNTDNILQIGQYNFETVPSSGPGTTTMMGKHYQLKSGATWDGWESQNAAAALDEEYAGDPFSVNTGYTNSDLQNNLSCVSNDEEAGFVFMCMKYMQQVEGAPDYIYTLTPSTPVAVCGHTPKRKSRPT